VGAQVEDALAAIDGWGAAHAAAAIIDRDGLRAAHGDRDQSFRWASVTKLLTAMTVLDTGARGDLDQDEAAGPPGSTVRHLLAHASGLPFEDGPVLAAPGRRRIYSNPGYDLLGALVADRVGVPFELALRDRVLEPLGMTSTRLVGRPSQGLYGTLADVIAFARECLAPTILPGRAFGQAVSVAFPGLPGVLPGVGRYDACDWGLGFEIRGAKAPHWTGTRNSPRTYGHFGGAGTFLWVDPVAGVALAVLTDREFGPWALEAWPALSDAVLDAVG